MQLRDASVGEPAVSGADRSMLPLLVSISKSTRGLLLCKLSALGFHNGQDELMVALDEDRPATVSKLAEQLGVRASTVSKMLDRLIMKGLVERAGDNRDSRRTIVRITPAGVDARDRVLRLWGEIEHDLMKNVGADAETVTRELAFVDRQLKTRLARLR